MISLTSALDRLYEGLDFDYRNWRNPIRPYFVTGIEQTPFEAYQKLIPGYKILVVNWIGHEPKRDEE